MIWYTLHAEINFWEFIRYSSGKKPSLEIWIFNSVRRLIFDHSRNGSCNPQSIYDRFIKFISHIDAKSILIQKFCFYSWSYNLLNYVYVHVMYVLWNRLEFSRMIINVWYNLYNFLHIFHIYIYSCSRKYLDTFRNFLCYTNWNFINTAYTIAIIILMKFQINLKMYIEICILDKKINIQHE